MKLYETKEHITREIVRKETELAQLKQKLFDAQIREFYWFLQDQVTKEENFDFLNATWKISIMGKTVELNNYADVFGGIEQTLINYMEEDEIEYEREDEKTEEPNATHEIYTAYAQHDNITFIMKDTLGENGEPCATEVVGWYHGEPDENNTKSFVGDLVAEYK